ncbi:MAG: amino acid permease [Candidatus Micrarchaeota archaeon]|nr:amino acid permease [Candidatus Micrarchaeota archaeon]
MMKRVLGFWQLLSVSLGSIIGTGIFLIPEISYSLAGKGAFFFWLLAGLLSFLMAGTFAFLSKNFTKSGGPILYVKKFGEFPGFLAGWLAWLVSVMTISSLALAIPIYLSKIQPVNAFAISVSVILLLTLINYFGVSFGIRAQMLLTGGTFFLLLWFISFTFPPSEIPLSFPEASLPFFLLLALVLEPFIGWEAPTIIAGEVKNPKKTVPKAIMLTALIVFILYILLVSGTYAISSGSVIDVVPPELFSLSVWAVVLINIACLNSWILASSRIPFSLAKENLLVKKFSHVSRFGTPGFSLFFQAVLASCVVFLGYLQNIYLILSSALVLYLLCFLSAGRKALPVAFITFLMLVSLPLNSLVFISAFVLLSVPLYALVKLTNDRKFVEKFYNFISPVFDVLFPLIYREERKEVIKNAELRDGLTVLDYGCGTGLTTSEILSAADVRVVAVDIAKKPMKKALERTKKHGKTVYIKISRPAPFESETFDRIICVGALDHFENPVKELKELYRVLKKGGIASFLAFGKSLGIPPEYFLRTDRNLKSVFRKAGFTKVSIKRKKRLGTEYIFIKAVKSL